MAKSKKHSLAAKKAATKAWATRRKNKATAAKIDMLSITDYKPLDGPLLEINAEVNSNPEPEPAVGSLAFYSIRETIKEMEDLVARLRSLVG